MVNSVVKAAHKGTTGKKNDVSKFSYQEKTTNCHAIEIGDYLRPLVQWSDGAICCCDVLRDVLLHVCDL